MKGHKFLMFAAAALSLAACTKDVVDTPRITADQTTSYAKISFTMPTNGATRAWGNPEFEEGTPDEYAIETIALDLYDENGVWVGKGEQVDEEEIVLAGGETSGVDYEGGVVFKLSLEEGAALPTQVVAYVNTEAQGVNLEDAYGYKTVEDYKNNGKFVMTNSAYFDGETFTAAYRIDNSKFFNTEAAAKGAGKDDQASTIYVERLAAKVYLSTAKTKENETVNRPGFDVKDADGNDLKLKFTEVAWDVTGTAKSTFKLKKEFSKQDWMVGNYRNYWAKGVNYTKDYEDYYVFDTKTYTDLLSYLTFDADNGDTSKNEFTHTGFDGTQFSYVHEHTYDYAKLSTDPAFSHIATSTGIMLIGKYNIEGTGSEAFRDGSNYDFYLIYGGVDKDTNKAIYTIYNETTMLKYLANKNNIEAVSVNGNTESQFAEAFAIAKEKGKYQLKVTNKAYFIKEKGSEVWKSISDIAGDVLEDGDLFPYKSNANHYYEGYTNFFIPIEHYKQSGVVDPEEGTYGVVRNHAYHVNVTKITGIGAPMDEDEVTGETPSKPDPDKVKDYYIQAELKVLQWHKVEQGVEL